MNASIPRGWITTFSGRRIWPLALRPADVVVEDVAHALAMKVRWGGFCRKFYSVAQHTVLLAEWLGRAGAPWQDRWDGLHHDDVEAYFVDLPAPLRELLPDYDEAEACAWRVICGVFGCSAELSPAVLEADRRIRADEARVLMTPPAGGWGDHGGGLEPLGLTIRPWLPEEAKERWLAAFDRLRAERPRAAAEVG